MYYINVYIYIYQYIYIYIYMLIILNVGNMYHAELEVLAVCRHAIYLEWVKQRLGRLNVGVQSKAT